VTQPAAHAGLERALELGAAMLDAARAGAWDEVARLDPERATLLRAPFPSDPRSHALLADLLAQNDALAQSVGTARAGLSDALGQHAHAHRALKAYVGYAG
jgi:hypothetical protein